MNDGEVIGQCLFGSEDVGRLLRWIIGLGLVGLLAGMVLFIRSRVLN